MRDLELRKNRNKGLRRDYEDPFYSLFGDFLEPFERVMQESDFVRHLSTDIEEDENNYYIKAEVPGLTKEDIDISYEENTITISANWNEESENSIRKGKFEKSFRVRNIDTEKMEANLDNGILKVVMPKSEEAKSRKVEIK